MAGRGRGRGRGAIPQQKEPIPGAREEQPETPPMPVPADPAAPLRVIIKSLSTEGDAQELFVTKGIATKVATTPQNLELVVQVIYERCYSDWKFAHCAAKICHELENMQVGETKFRAIVLRSIQKDFKVKESLRKDDNEKFLGCVAFLCQVFALLKDVDGQPYTILVTPVLEVLSLCLDKSATEDEILCVTTQIFMAGKLLQSIADKTKINQLKNVIRDKVLDNVGTRETRLRLIDVVEGFASNWRLHSHSK